MSVCEWCGERQATDRIKIDEGINFSFHNVCELCLENIDSKTDYCKVRKIVKGE